jgi:hypothetical protein
MVPSSSTLNEGVMLPVAIVWSIVARQMTVVDFFTICLMAF